MAHLKNGTKEGNRSMQKQKEEAMKDLELKKKKIGEELKVSNMENKFATHYDAIEQQIKSSTVGLVTLDEMRAKQEGLVKQHEMELALKKETLKQKELDNKNEQKEKQKRQVNGYLFDIFINLSLFV